MNKRTIFWLVVIILLTPLIKILSQSPSDNQKGWFAIGWKDNASDEHPRDDYYIWLSKSGNGFHDAHLTDLPPFSPDRTSGCGIAGSFSGKDIFVAINYNPPNDPGGIYVFKGTIHSIDNVVWIGPKYVGVDPKPRSAPACAVVTTQTSNNLPENIEIIAFNQGSSIVAYTFTDKHDPPQLINKTWPGSLNDRAYEKPSMATTIELEPNSDTPIRARVAMVYNNNSYCVISQGTIDLRNPNPFRFEKTETFPLSSDQMVPKIDGIGGPVITSDNEHFYVAVIQKDQITGFTDGDVFLGWNTVVYRSIGNDAFSGWQKIGTMPLDVHNMTNIGLAVDEYGTRVAAAERFNGHTNLWRTEIEWRPVNGPWTELLKYRISEADDYGVFSLVHFGCDKCKWWQTIGPYGPSPWLPHAFHFVTKEVIE